jgi:hypothetical protein
MLFSQLRVNDDVSCPTDKYSSPCIGGGRGGPEPPGWICGVGNVMTVGAGVGSVMTVGTQRYSKTP